MSEICGKKLVCTEQFDSVDSSEDLNRKTLFIHKNNVCVCGTHCWPKKDCCVYG